MKSRNIFACIVFLIAANAANRLVAQSTDSLISYNLPDSVKVISALQLFQLQTDKQTGARTGIRNNFLSFYYKYQGKKQTVAVKTPPGGRFLSDARGDRTRFFNDMNLYWTFRGKPADTLGLYLTCARDSASRKQLYSGYVYFPQQKKWKLLGTWEKEGVGEYYSGLQSAVSLQDGQPGILLTGFWYQQNTGLWKELSSTGKPVPPQNPLSDLDSAIQAKKEKKWISRLPEAAMLQEKDGLYYQILEAGNGSQVSLTDTVTIFYKGFLLKDGTVFDQTDKEPRTFPLNRLIKGWQIGLPLLKTGGKIKLIIPSGIGYGIRTRSAKIPPNSILVFEIEVVKTMPNALQH